MFKKIPNTLKKIGNTVKNFILGVLLGLAIVAGAAGITYTILDGGQRIENIVKPTVHKHVSREYKIEVEGNEKRKCVAIFEDGYIAFDPNNDKELEAVMKKRPWYLVFTNFEYARATKGVSTTMWLLTPEGKTFSFTQTLLGRVSKVEYSVVRLIDIKKPEPKDKEDEKKQEDKF